MSRLPVDLYRSRWSAPFFRPAVAQRVLQWLLIAAYVGLVALGRGLDSIPGVPDLHPRIYVHATPLLFWVLWFMGLVLTAPVLGRAWCGICPVGAVCDWVGRRGLGLRWPGWIASGWGAVAVLAVGVVAVALTEVNQSPHRTAVLVGAVGILALGSALLYRRAAFCRGLCPVGMVLQLYSRHAPVEVRPTDADRCGSCASSGGCVAREPSWRRWDLGSVVVHRRGYGGGCPVALYPPRMDQGACLLCLRCVRRCPEGNLGLFWGRRPAPRAPSRAGGAILVALAGLVSLALLRTWPDMRLALTPGTFPAPWFSALWIALGIPVLLFLLPGAAVSVAGLLRGVDAPAPGDGTEPPGRRRTRAGSGIVGVLAAFVGPILGAHAALALVKLNAKLGYLPYLAYDPTGAETYVAIHVAKVLPLPDLLLPLAGLRWLAVGVYGLGCLGGAREFVRWARGGADAVSVAAYGASWVALGALLGSALVHWLF